LIHVQTTFERFANGKSGDMSMNQKDFESFCEEMGMVNPGALSVNGWPSGRSCG
jgi:hypothetical protein